MGWAETPFAAAKGVDRVALRNVGGASHSLPDVGATLHDGLITMGRFGSTTKRSFVANRPAIRRVATCMVALAVFSPAIGVPLPDSQSGI